MGCQGGRPAYLRCAHKSIQSLAAKVPVREYRKLLPACEASLAFPPCWGKEISLRSITFGGPHRDGKRGVCSRRSLSWWWRRFPSPKTTSRFWNLGIETWAAWLWLRVISEHPNPAGWPRGSYPLWLRIAVISAHVEVFAVEVGALRMVYR